MKHCATILFFSAALAAAMTCHAQKSFRAARFYREIRRVSQIADPEKAIQKIESMLPGIPEGRKSIDKMRFIISFRLADLYVRTGAFPKAENLLSMLTDEVRRKKPGPRRAALNVEGTMYDCFEKLGYFYLETGNLRKAEGTFMESQTLRNSVFPPHSVHRIQPIVGLASLSFVRGDEKDTYQTFNKAEKLLERATSTMYDYDNIERLYLSNLAELCLLQGRNAEAWGYINKLSIASSGIGKFGSSIGR